MLRTLDQLGGKLNRDRTEAARGARLWPVFVLLLACQGETGAPGEPGVGGQGEQGPQGPDGAPPDGAASLSAVVPNTLYVGHDVDLVISGYATAWKESAPPTVVFSDPNLTAGPVTVASPTSLLMRIHVGDLAAVADKTLTLTVGDATYKGLSVERPLIVVPLWGVSDAAPPEVEQGSAALIEAYQLDVSTPYLDPRIFLRSPDEDLPEARIQQEALSAYTRTFLQLTDVNATPGDYDLVSADVPAHTMLSTAPAAITVKARVPQTIPDPSFDLSAPQPTPLPTSISATPSAPHASTLFALTNEDSFDEWLHLRLSTNDLVPKAGFFVLPESGKFADRVRIGSNSIFDQSLFQDVHVLTRAGEPHYVVEIDPNTESTSPFQLDLESDPVLDYEPSSFNNLVLESIDKPGGRDFYHLSAAKDDQLQLWLVGTGNLIPGFSTCNDFAAAVFVVSEADGTVIFSTQDSVCPGVDLNTMQIAPLSIPIPKDGNYLVVVSASSVLAGSPVFDYATFIGIVP